MTRISKTSVIGATLAGVALALAGIGGGSGGFAADTAEAAPRTAPLPIASRPTSNEAWLGRILYPVAARSGPKASARKVRMLSPFAPYNNGAQQLLILKAKTSVADGVWYLVRMPFRPNTATAWVPAEAMKVSSTPWRVKVDVSDRRATVYKGGRVDRTFRVAVGQSAFPTPTGRFAISEIVPQRGGTFFGPYIITLSAHSDRLNFFDGGRGRVALHGTNQPSLLGRAASHGCVRFANDAITYIGRRVPPGTPVDVVA